MPTGKDSNREKSNKNWGRSKGLLAGFTLAAAQLIGCVSPQQNYVSIQKPQPRLEQQVVQPTIQKNQVAPWLPVAPLPVYQPPVVVQPQVIPEIKLSAEEIEARIKAFNENPSVDNFRQIPESARSIDLLFNKEAETPDHIKLLSRRNQESLLHVLADRRSNDWFRRLAEHYINTITPSGLQLLGGENKQDLYSRLYVVSRYFDSDKSRLLSKHQYKSEILSAVTGKNIRVDQDANVEMKIIDGTDLRQGGYMVPVQIRSSGIPMSLGVPQGVEAIATTDGFRYTYKDGVIVHENKGRYVELTLREKDGVVTADVKPVDSTAGVSLGGIVMPESGTLTLEENSIEYQTTLQNIQSFILSWGEHRAHIQNLNLDRSSARFNTFGRKYNIAFGRQGVTEIQFDGDNFAASSDKQSVIDISGGSDKARAISRVVIHDGGMVELYNRNAIKTYRDKLISENKLNRRFFDANLERLVSFENAEVFMGSNDNEKQNISVASKKPTTIHVGTIDNVTEYLRTYGLSENWVGDQFLNRLIANEEELSVSMIPDAFETGSSTFWALMRNQLGKLGIQRPIKQTAYTATRVPSNIVIIPADSMQGNPELSARIDHNAVIEYAGLNLEVNAANVAINSQGDKPQVSAHVRYNHDSTVKVSELLADPQTDRRRIVARTVRSVVSKDKVEYVAEIIPNAEYHEMVDKRPDLEKNVSTIVADVKPHDGPSEMVYRIILDGSRVKVNADINTQSIQTKFEVWGNVGARGEINQPVGVRDLEGKIELNVGDLLRVTSNGIKGKGSVGKQAIVSGNADDIEVHLMGQRVASNIPANLRVSWDFVNKTLEYYVSSTNTRGIDVNLGVAIPSMKSIYVKGISDVKNDISALELFAIANLTNQSASFIPQELKSLFGVKNVGGTYQIMFSQGEDRGVSRQSARLVGGNSGGLSADLFVKSDEYGIYVPIHASGKDAHNPDFRFVTNGTVSLGRTTVTAKDVVLAGNNYIETIYGKLLATANRQRLILPTAEIRAHLGEISGKIELDLLRRHSGVLEAEVSSKGLTMGRISDKELYGVDLEANVSLRRLDQPLTGLDIRGLKLQAVAQSIGRRLSIVNGQLHINEETGLVDRIAANILYQQMLEGARHLTGTLSFESQNKPDDKNLVVAFSGAVDYSNFNGEVESAMNIDGTSTIKGKTAGDAKIRELRYRTFARGREPSRQNFTARPDLANGVSLDVQIQDFMASYLADPSGKLNIKFQSPSRPVELLQELEDGRVLKTGSIKLTPFNVEADLQNDIATLDGLECMFESVDALGTGEYHSVNANFGNIVFDGKKRRLSIGDVKKLLLVYGKTGGEEIQLSLGGNKEVTYIPGTPSVSAGFSIQLPSLSGKVDFTTRDWTLMRGSKATTISYPLRADLLIDSADQMFGRTEFVGDLPNRNWLEIIARSLAGQIPEGIIQQYPYLCQDMRGLITLEDKEKDFFAAVAMKGEQGIAARVKGLERWAMYKGGRWGLTNIILYPIREGFEFLTGTKEDGNPVSYILDFVGEAPHRAASAMFDATNTRIPHALIDGLVRGKIDFEVDASVVQPDRPPVQPERLLLFRHMGVYGPAQPAVEKMRSRGQLYRYRYEELIPLERSLRVYGVLPPKDMERYRPLARSYGHGIMPTPGKK